MTLKIPNTVSAKTPAIVRYKGIIDMDSFVDYIMLNEIVLNYELEHPKSVFMCKKGNKIMMSHLWDFDWAFGLHRGGFFIETASANWEFPGGWLFSRFFKDSEFKAKYKARWNEKYDDILSMTSFIRETADKISESQLKNYNLWYRGTENEFDFDSEVDKLLVWWDTRVKFLNGAINRR